VEREVHDSVKLDFDVIVRREGAAAVCRGRRHSELDGAGVAVDLPGAVAGNGGGSPEITRTREAEISRVLDDVGRRPRRREVELSTTRRLRVSRGQTRVVDREGDRASFGGGERSGR